MGPGDVGLGVNGRVTGTGPRDPRLRTHNPVVPPQTHTPKTRNQSQLTAPFSRISLPKP